MGSQEIVYGRYSMGSGSILSVPSVLWNSLQDSTAIEDYTKSLAKDLEKCGFSMEKLESSHVMDVGTGRQSLALLHLGAKKISHFDISPEFVSSLKSYIQKNNLSERMSSTQADLVDYALPTDTFDLLYLNGVIQHVSHIGRALENCAGAIKQGGTFWLYFYRSGTFLNFVTELLRGLIQNCSMREVHFGALQFFDEMSEQNLGVSNIMDDLFAPHIQLFSSARYMESLHALGFEVVSVSGLDEPDREINHSKVPEAVVVCAKRERRTTDGNFEPETMSPARSVSQADSSLYENHPEILETLGLFKELQHYLQENADEKARIFAVFRLFATADAIARNQKDGSARHAQFQKLLRNILRSAKRDLSED
jgi:ubiquinone/menaquinone biosynthesis C-methylase UbiE